MKKNSRSLVMLFVCLTIYYFLDSCNSSSKFHDNDKTGKLLNGPIKIKDYSTSNSELTLRDDSGNEASYVRVNKNQIVNWVVTDHRVNELDIISISPDPEYSPSNDPKFFSVPPHQQGDSKHWEATIGNPDSSKPYLKYDIVWKIKGNDSTYTYDPLMQINPK